MGSTTDGREVRRIRANIARLNKKPTAKLSEAQKTYLKDYVLGRIPHKRTSSRGAHRCAYCGLGGHLRGGPVGVSKNGTKVRV